VLTLLFAVMVVAQVALLVAALPDLLVLPAAVPPPLRAFRWTLVVVTVLGLLCLEIVIACTGKLLTLVQRDQIFSASALPWVDTIVWTIAAAGAVLLCATVPVAMYAQYDDAPGLMGVPLLMLMAVTALGLLMVVMRALLRQVTTLRTEMEAVI